MSNAETRLHFRIGYLGDAFHGSQIQPDVRTVQGELIHAFQKLEWISRKQVQTYIKNAKLYVSSSRHETT